MVLGAGAVGLTVAAAPCVADVHAVARKRHADVCGAWIPDDRDMGGAHITYRSDRRIRGGMPTTTS